jgi:hypothetical protein
MGEVSKDLLALLSQLLRGSTAWGRLRAPPHTQGHRSSSVLSGRWSFMPSEYWGRVRNSSEGKAAETTWRPKPVERR